MKILTYGQVEAAIVSSWDKIKEQYHPDCIVAISHGGDFVGEKYKSIAAIPLHKIIIQRPNRRPLYKRLLKVNKHLAWFVYELLFLIDKPRLVGAIKLPFYQNILIVEDGIHTGKTLAVCKKHVKQFNPKSIKVFSVMDISKRSLADFSVYKEKVQFPWSENYVR